ncbi:MAG: hypothetical protein IKE52_04820 [Mogibacterium sp.]|nr:hypothetical protein [Mogibacterium sp.]
MNGKTRKHLFKRISILLVSAALAVSAIPLSAFAEITKAVDNVVYEATSEPEFYLNGDLTALVDEVQNNDDKVQALIEYVYASYGKNNQRFKGRGECYGFAEMIRGWFGSGSKHKKIGKKPTKKIMYKYLKNCKPGTHIRFSAGKDGSGRAHSVALLKVTKDDIWFVHGNAGGAYNSIYVDKMDLNSFAVWGRRSYGYFAWTKQPKGRPQTVSSLDVKAASGALGNTYVAWRPVKNAKKYDVYRSLSKNSGYEKIATVRSSHFVDSSAPLGNVYYKVKANRKTSKATAASTKLSVPVVKAKIIKGSNPRVELTWKAVPVATKYKLVYVSEDRWLREAEVTGTSFTVNGDFDYFYGAVQASAGDKKTDSVYAVVEYYQN